MDDLIMPVGDYRHINLGIVKIDNNCMKLQITNPDKTSIFVIHNGEIKEVTKNLIYPIGIGITKTIGK